MAKWKHVFVLLLIFLLGCLIGVIVLPWTGWSDTRSHWGEPFFIFLLSSVLAVATHWLYRRSGLIFKIQAIILWIAFGATAAIAAYQVVISWLFICGYLNY